MNKLTAWRFIGGLTAIAAVLLLLDLFGVFERHYDYTLIFDDAGQLVKGNEVKVGGKRVGLIKEIELTKDNQASVKIRVDQPFAPLRKGTTAQIRTTSLSGVANRYVALTLALENSPKLKDHSTLKAPYTIGVVDLDQVINSFDAPTRKGFGQLVRGLGAQLKDPKASLYASSAIEQLYPALANSQKLAQALTADDQQLAAFVGNWARTSGVLASNRKQLKSLIANANTTAAAVGDSNDAIDRSLAQLPSTITHATTTLVSLRGTLDQLDRLVAATKPVLPQLKQLLISLRPTLERAPTPVNDLLTAIYQPGNNNDLTDAARALPDIQRAADPAFSNSTKVLKRAQPVLEFVRPFSPELIGFLHDLGAASAPYDANGHYLRVQPLFNAFSFTDNGNGGTLQMLSSAQRAAPIVPGAVKRCPGGASQPAADGSSPFLDGNAPNVLCQSSTALPGP